MRNKSVSRPGPVRVPKPLCSSFLRRRLWRWGLGVLVGGGVLVHADAAPTSWVHTNGNSSWFTSGNWSAGVPTVADDAFISSGTTAFIEGNTAAVADNVTIEAGALNIGNISPGTLNVTGELTVSSGALNLSYGTISLNRLSVGQNGTYSDTAFGTLNLTGVDPTIAMAPSVSMVINSLITGTNGLIKAGPGKLTLANNNTYSGGTTISIGTLQIGNGGTSGSLGDGDVLNNGSLVYNRSDNVTVTNFISGSGNFAQAGGGTVTLTADNTYSGGTTVSSGTLQVGNGGTTGSLGSGGVTNNGTLAFNRSDAITIDNFITGSGNLQQLGPNLLTLTANNNYSGTTTISSNSAIQVGNGGTTGTLGSGAVINNGALAFNRSDTLTVSNTISGTGNLTNAGNGTTILTANNSYSGLTVIAAGTLQVGNGGSTGSLGTNQVINNGALAFNRTNDFTVANLITGSGSVAHDGTGTLTLSGTNTFSGGLSVNNGGTLQLRNSSAGGTGDLNVNNGRLRADPGLTGGLEIKVGGNYFQGADGTLELGIGGALVASNQFDRITAAGTATLDGTLHLTTFNNYQARHSDVFDLIVATNGVTGTFSEFTNDIAHSVLLSPELVYHSNRVTLIWEHQSFVDFLVTSNVTLTANQKAVATSLDSILTSTHTNDVALINHLDYMGDLTNSLPASFDRIAPEELTAMLVASFTVMDAQGNQFLKRVGDLQSDYQRRYQESLGRRTKTKAAFDEYVNRSWDVYFELPFNSASVNGDANASGYDLSANGFTLGADRRVSEKIIVGGAFNYLMTSADLVNGGSLDVDTVSAQVYATWFDAGLHFEGMLGGGINSYETKRASVGGVASGDAKGFGFTTVIGGGYDWERGPWQFGPTLTLQYMNASIREFTESGSLAPLQIDSQSEAALHSQLGVKLRYRHQVGGAWTFITPEIQFGWRHDFLDNRVSLDSQFASGAGSGFTVTGPEMGRESIVLSFGCSVQWQPALNTSLNYTLQRGRNGYDSGFLNLGVRYSF